MNKKEFIKLCLQIQNLTNSNLFQCYEYEENELNITSKDIKLLKTFRDKLRDLQIVINIPF